MSWEFGKCAGLELSGEIQSGNGKPGEVNGSLEKRGFHGDMQITAHVT